MEDRRVSDTPRTDAVYEGNRFQEAEDLRADLAVLARYLERENAALREAIAQACECGANKEAGEWASAMLYAAKIAREIEIHNPASFLPPTVHARSGGDVEWLHGCKMQPGECTDATTVFLPKGMACHCGATEAQPGRTDATLQEDCLANEGRRPYQRED
jgi:hypothetical protein